MMTNYIKIFFTLSGLAFFLFAGYAYWAQPVSGDLTRISGLPDRLYGWNTPVQAIPLFEEPMGPADAPKVLVIGDSFSEHRIWQYLLADKYIFKFLHIRQLKRININDAINKHQPDIVIFESVEHLAMDRLIDIYKTQNTQCSSSSTPTPNPNISIAEINFPWKNRPQSEATLESISSGYHSLKFLITQKLEKPKEHVVLNKLNTNKLFSSTRSDILLSLSPDLLLNDDDLSIKIKQTQCAIVEITNSLKQSNIETFFLIVPDKTSAYQHYLVDDSLRSKPPILPQIQLANTDNIIDYYTPVKYLINQGYTDVYFPNDTHWGTTGYQLAAALVKYHIENHLRNHE